VFTACGIKQCKGGFITSSSVFILLIIKSVLTVLYTTSCKHSLVLLRMGEIIARNMLS